MILHRIGQISEVVKVQRILLGLIKRQIESDLRILSDFESDFVWLKLDQLVVLVDHVSFRTFGGFQLVAMQSIPHQSVHSALAGKLVDLILKAHSVCHSLLNEAFRIRWPAKGISRNSILLLLDNLHRVLGVIDQIGQAAIFDERLRVVALAAGHRIESFV